MIETKQLGSLEYLVCQDIPVPHCFTTRLGGISSGLYSAANGLDQLNAARETFSGLVRACLPKL